jgi:hypothetical protein
VQTLISGAVGLLCNRREKNPCWLKANERHSRLRRKWCGIYTEDLGPVGLTNIQILLGRYTRRIPGSTINLGLIGRDRGTPERSLLVEIITSDEEAVEEVAAEIRRSNGQAWVGVFISSGTFIEISGPKRPVVNLEEVLRNRAHEIGARSESVLAR